MKPEPKIVKIERGRFSPHFQVTRALLSAASALATTTPSRAVNYLDLALTELNVLRNKIAAM